MPGAGGELMKYVAIAMTVAAATSIAAGPVCADSDDLPKMIELTGSSEPLDAFASLSDERREEREARRLTMLEGIAANRAGMEQNGYIVVSDQYVASANALFNDVVKAPTAGNTEALTSSRMAYTPIDVEALEGHSGSLVGVLPVADDDGSGNESIHQMFYAFEFDEIGQLVIEELSYSTITDGSIRVTEPAGNVFINDIPATYTVAVNPDRSRAVSSLDFWNSRKKFTLTTSTRLPVGSDGYKKLIEIAEALD
jgi:hypothetical protein